MIAALAILALSASPASEADAGSTLWLAQKNDIVFLVPVDSLTRQGGIATALLVSVFRTPDESEGRARMDLTVEIDCEKRLIRSGFMTSYDLEDRVIQSADLQSEWEGVGELPPLVNLAELACNGRTGSLVHTHTLSPPP